MSCTRIFKVHEFYDLVPFVKLKKNVKNCHGGRVKFSKFAGFSLQLY